MYIDKIYTKLYSERNWNGLRQLVNEIRSFTRKDYKDLDENQASELRNLRDKIAEEMAEKRAMARGYKFMNKRLEDIESDVHKIAEEGGAGINNEDIKNQMSEFLFNQLNENKKNADEALNRTDELSKLGDKVTSNYRKNKLGSKWNPFRAKVTDGLSKEDRELLGL